MADYQNPNNPNDPMFNSEMPPPPGYGMPPGGMPPPEDDSEMDSGMPTVAAAPGRVLVVMLGGILIVGFVLYLLFGGDDDSGSKRADEPIQVTTNTGPATQQPLPTPPPVPDPPRAQPTQLPPPPPPVAAPPPPAPVSNKVDPSQLSKVQQERRASSLLVHGGRGSTPTAATRGQIGYAGSDPNLAFTREYLENTGANQAEATLMGNMNYIVAQGKVIDAILETAINTDLPGPLRAIVSRDVYAESGREIMIPKGSRLIGSYNSGIERGQTRVYVIWQRVIRPDGIDIQVDSPGVDSLGRAGVAGYVDNKYTEMFMASLLTSTVSIGLGIAADEALSDSGTSQTNTSDGTTTSSGSAGSQAVLEGIRDFSDTSEQILRGILEQEPTITVDQGTRIKVFVNRDLIMPSSVLEQTRFIQ
jgi:type IV secretion system protein VirB10